MAVLTFALEHFRDEQLQVLITAVETRALSLQHVFSAREPSSIGPLYTVVSMPSLLGLLFFHNTPYSTATQRGTMYRVVCMKNKRPDTAAHTAMYILPSLYVSRLSLPASFLADIVHPRDTGDPRHAPLAAYAHLRDRFEEHSLYRSAEWFGMLLPLLRYPSRWT